MSTAVETRNKEMAKSAHDLLEKLKPSIAAVLPRHLTPERMAMIAFTAMRRNPELMKCSAQSIIGSIMTASMLGLEPSGPLGHGALIPYKGECQFQPMYQGLLELARRSGLIKDVQLRAVYKGDHYRFVFGLEPTIEHIPLEGAGADNPDRECTHVYCIIRFTNGGIQWDQMSMAQAMAHGKRFSKTYYNGKFTPGTPWADHPVAMCLKTILKQTLKLCPKSPEMASAMLIDDFTEGGRMATAKRLTDGTLDVDFDEEPESNGTDKGKVNMDDLRPGKEENRGHGNENLASAAGNSAQGGPEAVKGAGSTPPDAAEECTVEDFVEIEKAANAAKVSTKAVADHVKNTMGFEKFGQLTKARKAEVLKWIDAVRK